jgi:hypothetical protein
MSQNTMSSFRFMPRQYSVLNFAASVAIRTNQVAIHATSFFKNKISRTREAPAQAAGVGRALSASRGTPPSVHTERTEHCDTFSDVG